MNNTFNISKTLKASLKDIEGLEKYYKSKTPRFDKIAEEFEEGLDHAKFVKCYDLNCVSCKEFYFRGYTIHIKELEQTFSTCRYFSLQVKCDKDPYINEHDERYREFSNERYLGFTTGDNLNEKTTIRHLTIRKFLNEVMSHFIFDIKAAINDDRVDEVLEVLEGEDEI